MPVIDFHAHVFPNPIEKALPYVPKLVPPGPAGEKLKPYLNEMTLRMGLGMVRRMARQFFQPATEKMHSAQVWTRHLPASARHGMDSLGGVATLPHLLVESTAEDLIDAMDAAGVDQTLVIAHPPFCTNEFVLQACEQNPDRLIAVANVPKGSDDPAATLRGYIERGAKALKIHPAADGEGVDCARYRALLEVAQECRIPVILHTGCIHNRLFFKDPHLGKVELFTPWFEAYREVKFILAHMNFHEPLKAIELCELYSNLYVDTSWQPPEVISEAISKLGADRVLFGTDWPFVGTNISLGKSRIEEGVQSGVYTREQADLVLGGNALRILKDSGRKEGV
ncbi:MAG: amidohydrolase family protein [Bdellovibrionales bacterium]|nr:amidohydrolase family protein [Bdellovibrionales bacterium]